MPEKAFPQTHAGMVKAVEFVEASVGGLGADVRDRAILVAGEVLANAVEHGGENPQLQIRVEVIATDRQLELVVHESGAGVDMERLIHSDLPGDPLALSGRGLYLIRTLADRIEPIEEQGYRFTFRPRVEA